MSDIPQEIKQLRARLRQLEELASSTDGFNRAIRNRRGKHQTPPPEPQEEPAEGPTFNQAFRRLAGHKTGE